MALFLPKDRFSLDAFHGTLWSGGAVKSAIHTSEGSFNLGHLEWDFSPSSWLTLAPKITFQANWGDQSILGSWKIGFGDHIEFFDSHGVMDVSTLNQLFLVSVDGILEWEFDNFFVSFGDKAIGGDGRLVWRGAKTFVNGRDFNLGSYSADLVKMSENTTSIELGTLKGPVSIDGTVSISERGYRTDLKLDGLQEVDTNVVAFRFLQLMPVVNGVHEIKLEGAFP